jgi:predicted phage-related endonuclease
VWDDELIGQLREVEGDFWNNHIVPGVIPNPDGSKVCDEVLEKYFHVAKKASAIELVGFDEKLARREEILAYISELQTEQKQIEQEIKLFMQDNELAVNEHYKVSWSNVDTTRLDTKRIKQEKPDVYADYAKTTSSRRFSVNAA